VNRVALLVGFLLLFWWVLGFTFGGFAVLLVGFVALLGGFDCSFGGFSGALLVVLLHFRWVLVA